MIEQNQRSRRLLSLTTEAIVIVFSILLAFAIDAYWDERQDRAREAQLVGQLERELELYLGLLDQARGMMDRSTDNIDELLNIIHTGKDYEPDEVGIRVLQLQQHYRLADATATFQFLISDENFRLLRNVKLKESISDTAAFIALVGQFEDEETAFINESYTPFVRQYIDLYSMKSFFRWMEDTPPSQMESDFDSLFNSREFSNLLVERKSKAGIVRVFREQVRKSIDIALEVLQEES